MHYRKLYSVSSPTGSATVYILPDNTYSISLWDKDGFHIINKTAIYEHEATRIAGDHVGMFDHG